MALLQKHEDSLMTGEELLRRPDLNPCELVTVSTDSGAVFIEGTSVWVESAISSVRPISRALFSMN